MMSDHKHITLLELQTLIKSKLEGAIPFPFWVTAEISEMKVNYSGHCYLELIEKGGTNQIPKAKVQAVIWRSTYGMLSSYFASQTGSALIAGMNVLLKVSVTYHELYGLSLSISDIDPLYTLGDMERQRQETIRRLQEEGIFDMNRSLELPPVIQRIAVISSRNAAGYQDFMNELTAGGYHFEVTLFDSFMQGHGAEDSLIESLYAVADAAEKFDVVVIIRGGGSQSDLAAFDSYRLSSHIAQFPLPVITGIGHDKDQSIADLVAAISLKTPTAVAAWLIGRLAEFEGFLNELYNEVLETAVGYLDGEKRRIQSAALLLSQASGGLTRSMEVRLERLAGEIIRRKESILSKLNNRLEVFEVSMREKIYFCLSRENSRLELAQQMTMSRRSEKILSLGFAIVRNGGEAMMDSNRLKKGDMLDITLSKGSVIANVKSIGDGEE